MHRSASTSRASDEFLINLSSPASKGSPGLKGSDGMDKIPMYDPISDDATKKETSPHLKSNSGENVIHLIPLILIFCALILWVFSHPVDLTRNGGLITEKIQGLSSHPQSNQTGLPSTMKAENSDELEGSGEEKTERYLADKSG